MDAKERIKGYLDERAKRDEAFAEKYKNEKKSIDRCFDYVMGEACKLGSAVCLTDEEVYGMAVHYYDEASVKINALPKGMRGDVATSGTKKTGNRTEEAGERTKEAALGTKTDDGRTDEAAPKKKHRYTAKEKAAMKKEFEDRQLSLF